MLRAAFDNEPARSESGFGTTSPQPEQVCEQDLGCVKDVVA
jgi:hypothetical protein